MKIFIGTYTGMASTYPLDVEPTTTIRQMKDLFSQKARYDETLSFIFDGDVLDQDEATLQSYGIDDNSCLKLMDLNIRTRNMGSLGLKFVDVSNTEGLKRIEWSKTAPEWRKARHGLCLEGECTNPQCKAYGHQVIIPIGYRKIDVVRDADDTVCPICKEYVEPINCGFNNCWWKFEGVKLEPGRKGPIPCRSDDWSEVDNAYHYFDRDTTGMVQWRKLELEAVKKKPV